MEWNEHLNLSGKHALLGASQHAWVNYDSAHLEQVFINNLRKERGTYLHDFASRAIKNRIKLARLKKALNLFVNDAIGFGMESEKVLYYSDRCFGTADAISFNDSTKLLRIHDLKTGVRKPPFDQLDIYSALFCLEYGYNPLDLGFVERLYQDNEYRENIPDPNHIKELMSLIIEFDEELRLLQEKAAKGEI